MKRQKDDAYFISKIIDDIDYISSFAQSSNQVVFVIILMLCTYPFRYIIRVRRS